MFWNQSHPVKIMAIIPGDQHTDAECESYYHTRHITKTSESSSPLPVIPTYSKQPEDNIDSTTVDPI